MLGLRSGSHLPATCTGELSLQVLGLPQPLTYTPQGLAGGPTQGRPPRRTRPPVLRQPPANPGECSCRPHQVPLMTLGPPCERPFPLACLRPPLCSVCMPLAPSAPFLLPPPHVPPHSSPSSSLCSRPLPGLVSSIPSPTFSFPSHLSMSFSLPFPPAFLRGGLHVSPLVLSESVPRLWFCALSLRASLPASRPLCISFPVPLSCRPSHSAPHSLPLTQTGWDSLSRGHIFWCFEVKTHFPEFPGKNMALENQDSRQGR